MTILIVIISIIIFISLIMYLIDLPLEEEQEEIKIIEKENSNVVIRLFEINSFLNKIYQLELKDFQERTIDRLYRIINGKICLENFNIDKNSIFNFICSLKKQGIDIDKMIGKERILEIIAQNLPENYMIIEIPNYGKYRLELFKQNFINMYGDDELKKHYYLAKSYCYDRNVGDIIARVIKDRANLTIVKFGEFLKPLLYSNLSGYMLYKDEKPLPKMVTASDIIFQQNAINWFIEKTRKDVLKELLEPYICKDMLEKLGHNDINSFLTNLNNNGIDAKKIIENIPDYQKTLIFKILEEDLKIIDIKISNLDLFPYYETVISNFKSYIDRYENAWFLTDKENAELAKEMLVLIENLLNPNVYGIKLICKIIKGGVFNEYNKM